MINRGFFAAVTLGLLAAPAMRGDNTYDWLAGT